MVDGYDVALLRMRTGQAVGLREFFAGLLAAHGLAAAEPSTAKPGRALSMGTRRSGKRKHFDAGEVTGSNVDQFVRSWRRLGLIAKAPDGGLAAGPGRTA